MTEANQQALSPQDVMRARKRKMAAGLFLMTFAMIGLTFASVPLYRLFCQVTGYGGTTQRAETEATQVLDREITIRFDSNVSSELGWDFKPVQREIRLKIGESQLAFFQAANETSGPLTGTSTFNVTPEIAGVYFNKLECFCFTEQTLQAGQSVDMPVQFFIDPAIADDPDTRNIREITLSYTFFKVKKPDSAASMSGGAASRTFENAGPPG